MFISRNTQTIYLLLDYKGRFGSKNAAATYRGGMDVSTIIEFFAAEGYDVELLNFSQVDFRSEWKNKVILYTSQEDDNLRYKSFIEDIIFGLEEAGAEVIPKFAYLRANNNKVFMEVLRDLSPINAVKNISSRKFGCFEEVSNYDWSDKVPVVLKSASGAMSKGVRLARSIEDTRKYAAELSYSPTSLKDTFREIIRSIKHKGYRKESSNRNKFITQNFIPGLTFDYKVIIYGDEYFVLRRNVRANDFRSSGSGLFEFVDEVPEELLNFSKSVFSAFNVPNISLDVAIVAGTPYLLEFQFVYFGNKTVEWSKHHFEFLDSKWQKIKGEVQLEKSYVKSIVGFLSNRF